MYTHRPSKFWGPFPDSAITYNSLRSGPVEYYTIRVRFNHSGFTLRLQDLRDDCMHDIEWLITFLFRFCLYCRCSIYCCCYFIIIIIAVDSNSNRWQWISKIIITIDVWFYVVSSISAAATRNVGVESLLGCPNKDTIHQRLTTEMCLLYKCRTNKVEKECFWNWASFHCNIFTYKL